MVVHLEEERSIQVKTLLHYKEEDDEKAEGDQYGDVKFVSFFLRVEGVRNYQVQVDIQYRIYEVHQRISHQYDIELQNENIQLALKLFFLSHLVKVQKE